MAGLKTEMTGDEVISTETDGTLTETSTLAESTCPCANSVTAQVWLAFPASAWRSLCSDSLAASVSISATTATSKTERTVWTPELK